VSALIATGSQTVGPFFHFGLTADGAANAVPVPAHLPHAELVVRVTDGNGDVVTDAAVEIWYSAETALRGAEPLALFARLPTGADGTCRFDIARPVPVAVGGDATAAAHVNLCLFARGLLRHLHTRIYFSGDAALAHDPLLGYVPEDRRTTLLARRDPEGGERWLFDLRLQGADETVFFDV
jgi:protocatechuate 3,4-dioxygenase alpha subunit